MNRYDALVGGKRSKGQRGYAVRSPLTGERLGEAPDMDAAELDGAVEAARTSADGWRDLAAPAKEKLFWKWAEIIDGKADALGRLAAAEGGHSVKARTAGFHGYADYIRYFAGYLTKDYGDVLLHDDEKVVYVVREPHGVCVIMPSWNQVALGAIAKATPALVTGNTVVIRAPAAAPLSTLALGETVQEAGFPDGAINIVSGRGRECNIALAEHEGVDMISFTGSFETGARMQEIAGRSLKRVTLELGGKSPLVLFEDVDVGQAADTALRHGLIYQGQVCSAVSRVLVHRSILDEVVEGMKALASRYELGDLDAATQERPVVGPIINRKQYDSILGYIETGKRDGRLVCGGGAGKSDEFPNGLFIEPTIFLFEDDASDVCRKEIFGPVISVIPFETEEEAIRLANGTEYGLTASVWTRDEKRIQRCLRRIKAGTIWVNGYNQYSHHTPWGGFKRSGQGREWGMYALDDFRETKCVWRNAMG